MAAKETGVDQLLNFESTRLQGDEKWSYLEYKYLIQPWILVFAPKSASETQFIDKY